MKNVLLFSITGIEYFLFVAESGMINKVNADDRREKPSAIIYVSNEPKFVLARNKKCIELSYRR